jgi:hypothetical protein
MVGKAFLTQSADGSFQYFRETKVWSDEQQTVRDAQGRATLFCINDHEWQAEIKDEIG